MDPLRQQNWSAHCCTKRSSSCRLLFTWRACHSFAVGPADGGMSVLSSSAALGPGNSRLLAVLPPPLPLGCDGRSAGSCSSTGLPAPSTRDDVMRWGGYICAHSAPSSASKHESQFADRTSTRRRLVSGEPTMDCKSVLRLQTPEQKISHREP